MGESQATNLPFFSEFVRPGNAMHTGAFGYEWGQCLRPVHFFKIELNTSGITAIENATQGRARNCYVNEKNRVFASMADEVVTQVDICCAQKRVQGVRFHTNKRVEQWFGSHQGEVSTLKAPEGYCIHSFAGRIGDVCDARYRTPYVVQLGVLFSPVNRPTTSVLKGKLSYSARDGEPTFSEACPDMHGIMIQTSRQYLSSVAALSTWDGQVLAALSGQLDEPVGQHLIELLPDERVVRARVVQGLRVQFKTTHRTTPWYGCAGGEDVDTFEVADMPEGSYICGFHTYAAKDLDGRKKIGVVYWAPDH